MTSSPILDKDYFTLYSLLLHPESESKNKQTTVFQVSIYSVCWTSIRSMGEFVGVSNEVIQQIKKQMKSLTMLDSSSPGDYQESIEESFSLVLVEL